MDVFIWLVLAWLAGTATILGSLLAIASVLLWFVPDRANTRTAKTPAPRSVWFQRWRLTGTAMMLALSGLTLLVVMPFPSP